LVPLFWFAQGTILWALFVVGHDCGHGSFSRRPWINTLVGHLTHTPLLVPYHAWRLSHRIHHRHTGDIGRDEGWHPLTAAEVDALPAHVRFLRFRLPLLAFPFYLARRSPNRIGSHFRPRSVLFRPRERRRVATSVVLCGAFLVVLLTSALFAGPVALVRWYVGPYLVFVVWIDLVTYLHHTDASLPWYRNGGWTFEKGALSTVDRRYGLFERLHHDAGCHVVHHLFPAIPHYRLREAAAAIRPMLGARYREDQRPIWRALLEAIGSCEVVPAVGAVVYYEPRVTADAVAPLGSEAAPRPATR